MNAATSLGAWGRSVMSLGRSALARSVCIRWVSDACVEQLETATTTAKPSTEPATDPAITTKPATDACAKATTCAATRGKRPA